LDKANISRTDTTTPSIQRAVGEVALKSCVGFVKYAISKPSSEWYVGKGILIHRVRVKGGNPWEAVCLPAQSVYYTKLVSTLRRGPLSPSFKPAQRLRKSLLKRWELSPTLVTVWSGIQTNGVTRTPPHKRPTTSPRELAATPDNEYMGVRFPHPRATELLITPYVLQTLKAFGNRVVHQCTHLYIERHVCTTESFK
jgi:hypothetical protein